MIIIVEIYGAELLIGSGIMRMRMIEVVVVAVLMMVPRVLSVDFVDQGSGGGGGGEDISKLVVTSSSSFLFFSLQANVFSGDIYKEELLWKCQISK